MTLLGFLIHWFLRVLLLEEVVDELVLFIFKSIGGGILGVNEDFLIYMDVLSKLDVLFEILLLKICPCWGKVFDCVQSETDLSLVKRSVLSHSVNAHYKPFSLSRISRLINGLPFFLLRFKSISILLSLGLKFFLFAFPFFHFNCLVLLSFFVV